MSRTASDDAWDNFVMNSSPGEYHKNGIKNAAANATTYMSQASRTGINSFLTNNWELDAEKVYEALEILSPFIAAKQLKNSGRFGAVGACIIARRKMGLAGTLVVN